MERSPRDELADLAAMARELGQWEQSLGGVGVPPVPLSHLPSLDAPDAPEPEPASSGVGALAVAEQPKDLPAGAEDRVRRLTVLSKSVAACVKCGLHEKRTNTVFARGSATAEIAFVGEGPGYHEDQSGLPFVGRAGNLLDKMVAAMGYQRDDVYVCNVVKCRPPENRTPLPPEAAACKPYLEQQIQLVAPKVIVALGRCAAEHLGCLDAGARGWRGRWSTWRDVPVMPTYHPAFLLRSPDMKRPVWEDLKKVMEKLGRPV